MKVKIVRVGSPIKEIFLPNTATVAQALQAAGVEPGPNEKVWVDGELTTDLSSKMVEGEELIILARVSYD